jgi:hypothetical protein
MVKFRAKDQDGIYPASGVCARVRQRGAGLAEARRINGEFSINTLANQVEAIPLQRLSKGVSLLDDLLCVLSVEKPMWVSGGSLSHKLLKL